MKGNIWLQIGVIVAAVFAIYARVLHGDWLWDDNIDITDNAITQSPTGLWAIWFEPGSQLDYYPIKASVQWLQWHLWGMDTFGYHLTNVLLHIVGSLLVWRLLSKLGLKFAWLGGLLFAIHPANVESVAWIAELKNTLSLPPFLLAMIAWIYYDKSGKRSDYVLSLTFFLIAMLCKTTMAMFPVLILLYAWWKRGRIAWSDVKASVLFFVVSLVLGLVTFVNASVFIRKPAWVGGFPSHLALTGTSLGFYFFKCFWPVGLLPVYPKWNIDPPSFVQFLPWVIVVGAIWGCWVKKRTWGRHVLLGIGFFGIMLAPFLGFKTVAYMNFTWVMDHFLYIPMIGLIGVAMFGVEILDAKLPPASRPFMLGLIGGILALLGFGSFSYAGDFINSETLWTYTLLRNPACSVGYNNLGKALSQKGEIEEAEAQFQKATEINPNDAHAFSNLGTILFKKGLFAESIVQYQNALKVDPRLAEAHYNLGNAFLQTGHADEAMAEFEKALEIKPNIPEAHRDLGLALIQKGQIDEAIVQFQKAIEINPNYAEAHLNLGNALSRLGQVDEAIAQYQMVLKIEPSNIEAHNNLGGAFLKAGRASEAMIQYQDALKIDPKLAEAHNNLGNILLQNGHLDEAVAEFEKALETNPNIAQAQCNLGLALFQKGLVDEAIVRLQRALEINPNYANAHNYLGAVLFQKGRSGDAIVHFQEALRLKPDYDDAKKNLAKVQAMMQQSPISK